MNPPRSLRWPSIVGISFLFALVHCGLWIFCLARGWIYFPTVFFLMGLERLGLPTLGISIEGWPLPSLFGWCILFGLSWLLYAALVVGASRVNPSPERRKL